jgi:hypothetical protein
VGGFDLDMTAVPLLWRALSVSLSLSLWDFLFLFLGGKCLCTLKLQPISTKLRASKSWKDPKKSVSNVQAEYKFYKA